MIPDFRQYASYALPTWHAGKRVGSYNVESEEVSP